MKPENLRHGKYSIVRYEKNKDYEVYEVIRYEQWNGDVYVCSLQYMESDGWCMCCAPMLFEEKVKVVLWFIQQLNKETKE